MIKIEALIRPQRFEEVKAALDAAGATGMTVTEVRGAGKQKGRPEFYRGEEYTVTLLSKIKIEVVVADAAADRIVGVIIGAARTGEVGDGKIFLTLLSDVIRIRTGEKGELAI